MDIIRTEDDFHTSLEKALEEIEPHWRKLTGVVVLGTHAPKKIGEKISQIKWAREQGIPCLGICMGMQLMAIEYARNVKLIEDATSEELGEGTHIVKKLPVLRVGIKSVNGKKESHWHNYTVLPEYLKEFETILSDTDSVVEEIRLASHPFFMGTQYHPEYQSSEFNPHPVLTEFINACKKYGNAVGLRP